MSICETTLPEIKRTECIGNSLDTINSNFATLKVAACDNYNTITSLQIGINDLNTRISALTAQTPGFAKAWVSFDGTKDVNGNISVQAVYRYIYNSYNISGVYKLTGAGTPLTTTNPTSAGDYRIYFTNSFADKNYVVTGTSFEAKGNSSYGWVQPYNITEQYVDVRIHSSASPITDTVDPTRVSVVIY